MAVTVALPGNYLTFCSGFGEFYPDLWPNQKNRVKIDIEVKKTLKAAINGEDDMMMKSLSIINENKYNKSPDLMTFFSFCDRIQQPAN